MKSDTKVMHISELALDDPEIQVKRPFTINQERKRRFIRLEISTPVELMNVRGLVEAVPGAELAHQYQGSVLNISIGGALVELNEPLSENDIVLMRFTVQQNIQVKNVLGLVKRVDRDEDTYLTGIEFISVEHLKDNLSQAEIDLINERVGDFHSQIQATIDKYLYKEKKR